MTPIDRESPPEDARGFEQWLLDSARSDELPRNVGAAWARFGASLAGIGQLAAQGVVARGARAVERVQPGASSAAILARGARILAVKWLLVGVLAGSALTALVMSRARDWGRAASEATPSARLVASAALTPPIESGAAQPVRAAVSAPNPEGSVSPVVPRRVSTRQRRSAGPSDSTLGAQVALLDAARTAALAGAPSEALALTDRFQRQFPKGELAPDAEVVAIEALAAAGDGPLLTARIERFLARYPADPHAARVKALLPR